MCHFFAKLTIFLMTGLLNLLDYYCYYYYYYYY